MTRNKFRNYRPKLHFSPLKGWTNDPNGLVYENGNFHLFYQHYPEDTKWGPMHWGHAISKDLINWDHLPIALEPDALGTIFSGSAIYDRENTTGFAHFGKAPIITMFTHHGESEQQSIAYSLDGINYIKHSENPVIENPGIKDFRDPKIFYNEKRKSWSCVLVAGDRVHFYSSKDLKEWEKTGEFGPEGNLCPGIWECPDIFPLKDPKGKEIWVLIVSMSMPLEEGGPKTQYFLGDFDGDSFINTYPFGDVEWIDPGFDNYAAMSYYGEDLKDRIIIAWANNWGYAADTPTNEYSGIMTLPRKLSLIETEKGLRLSSQLCESLGNMVGPPKIINSEKDIEKEVFGFRIESNDNFTVILSNNFGAELLLGINKNNEIFMDRSKAGEEIFSKVFSGERYSLTKRERFFSGSIVMEGIFDHSILEVFADKGSFASSQLVYPKNPYTKIRVEGDVKASYFDIEV